MFSQSLLMVVMCACAAAAAANNVTSRGRSFGFFDVQPAYEQIPLPDYDDAASNRSNASSASGAGAGAGRQVSAEALHFLTGPVSTVLMPSFYTLVCLLSVPLNACAVAAFALRIRPKKPAAIYMLNLACADLLFAALLPFKIHYHFAGNHWAFGPLMCRAVTAAFYWNMYCSVLLIACISVDRLLAVVYPIESLSWRRPRKALAACAAMWAISFAGAAPLVASEQTARLDQLNVTTCHDVLDVEAQVGRHRVYFLVLCCALFFLPLVVTAASYARVIWSLSRVPGGVLGSSRRKTRAAAVALTVLVMFALCFTPTNCLLLAHYLQFNGGAAARGQAPDGSYAAYLVFMCLGSLNCVLDPLVYYFGSSQCQRELSGMLRCERRAGGGGSSGISHSSSNSCRSSSRAILKSGCTENSRLDTQLTAVHPFQANLNGQYKKLLV